MSERSPRYSFGPFLLVPAERQLFREGRPVALTPRSYDVLVLLAQQPGHLLSKEELLDGAWPGVVVEENALSVAVSRLRAALGEAGQGLIETVPGRGYRLLGPVERLSDDEHGWAASRGPRLEDVLPSVSHAGDGVAPANPPVIATDPPVRVERVVALLAAGFLVILVALMLSAGKQPARTAIREPVPEALQAYRRGRAIWELRAPDMDTALREFKLAADLDPDFALAHLGEAQVYAFIYRSGEEAEGALDRALELDSTLGEAWATRAFVRAFQYWDWDGAERAFSRALQLEPQNVTTLQWLAALSVVQRRLPEAEVLLQRALSRAPDYATLHADVCELRYFRRDLEGARVACERARALEPTHTTAARYLELIELASPEGRGELERRLRSDQRYAWDDFYMARLFAYAGMRDSTLAAVESVVQARYFVAPFLNPDGHFDFVRDDPRWVTAMSAMGL